MLRSCGREVAHAPHATVEGHWCRGNSGEQALDVWMGGGFPVDDRAMAD